MPDECCRQTYVINYALDLKAKFPHCTRWTYASSSSFYDLDPRNETNHKDSMYSRIHFYYADFAYRQHQEVKESSIYIAFCDFGNVVGLYWGMSIISFFHVFFYVPRFFYCWKESRKHKDDDEALFMRVATKRDVPMGMVEEVEDEEPRCSYWRRDVTVTEL